MTAGTSYIYPTLGRAANKSESVTGGWEEQVGVGGCIGKEKGKCSGGFRGQGWEGGSTGSKGQAWRK